LFKDRHDCSCLIKSQLLRRWRQEDGEFKASPGKVKEALSQKQNVNKRAGSLALKVKCLPSACETLSSIPKTTKKRRKNAFSYGKKT
jgi:hypothetical protein